MTTTARRVTAVAELEPEAEPAEAGFDPERLARIDRHFARYVASTAFWVDQAEQLTVGFYTQLLPSSAYRLRPQLRQLVYQALVDEPPAAARAERL
jgi:hypothetical protein